MSQKRSFDLDEIWHTTADLEIDDSHITKYEFFLMADSRHIENRFCS